MKRRLVLLHPHQEKYKKEEELSQKLYEIKFNLLYLHKYNKLRETQSKESICAS